MSNYEIDITLIPKKRKKEKEKKEREIYCQPSQIRSYFVTNTHIKTEGNKGCRFYIE